MHNMFAKLARTTIFSSDWQWQFKEFGEMRCTSMFATRKGPWCRVVGCVTFPGNKLLGGQASSTQRSSLCGWFLFFNQRWAFWLTVAIPGFWWVFGEVGWLCGRGCDCVKDALLWYPIDARTYAIGKGKWGRNSKKRKGEGREEVGVGELEERF